jgi:hypothetical protein
MLGNQCQENINKCLWKVVAHDCHMCLEAYQNEY